MNDDQLQPMRHSLAHIMASAVLVLWPNAKLGVGPAVENGFYYDIVVPNTTISEDDFGRIELEMKKIIDEKQEFIRSEKTIEDAIKWANTAKQDFKSELLNDLHRAGTTVAKDLDAAELGTLTDGGSSVENASFYTNGAFTDLCRGPHVENTGQVGAFKLMKVAGAYWRGNEKNPQMQRLYGVAFETGKELRKHIERLEEAKKRDHRKLGKELDLFTFSDQIGSGLPVFTPRGTTLRNELIRYSEELQRAGGYQAVWTPHITKNDLYKTSGHYEKYPERFDVTSVESDDEFMMKPMNCPHVTQIYASRQRSYRDLPLRYMETTTMYRDEKRGELHGLSRVRALTQDDSHAFVRHDQIADEMASIITMVKQMYSTLDLPLTVDLSFKDDSDDYFGDEKLWNQAQKTLEDIAQDQKLDYNIELGEAAFYGPKIDIHVSDSLGRKWQCATIQIDFVQPERFGLEYTDENGEMQRPAMIHKAILGSIERFLSVYIEHTAGKFPVWLAPEQIRVITVNQQPDTVTLAEDIVQKSTELQLRATVDNSSESVGKKIRSAVVEKIPYILVIGDKEIESGNVVPRVREDIAVQGDHQPMAIKNFLSSVSHEYLSRASKSSL